MKKRKNEWGNGRQRHGMRLAAVLGAALLLAWCDPIVSHAEAEGTVIPPSLKIREAPDQNSEVIGSAAGGKDITIRGKVDASGYTWYQVYVQGDTLGYVRADMVEKKGDGDIPTVSVQTGDADTASDEGAGDDASSESASETPALSGGAQVQAQEEMPKQYAIVKTKSNAKVRPDPSTSNNPVDSVAPDTQVVVSGKSEGSDSKTWYFVTFTASNGSEKTGYIRSDLLELGEMLPEEEVPVEEPVEEPEEPEPVQNKDYELVIETDSEGAEIWYIHDNVTGQKQKLVPLLEASYAQTLGSTEDTGTIVKQRIAIVVLAVLLVALVVAVIIMAFKLRDAYYEDEEDDEDEEEEERRPARRERETREGERDRKEGQPRRRTAEEEERRPRRREGAEAAEGRSDRPERRRREPSQEDREDLEERAKQPAKTRKAKNFLLDDDEFEFEFLNMDDKDLK